MLIEYACFISVQYHPYILCQLLCTCTTKLSTCTLAYSHSLTTHQQGTQDCPLHRFQHTRQPMCAMLRAAKVHNMTQTQLGKQAHHRSCTPQILHARKTTSAMLMQWQSSCSQSQHDFSMHINMHYKPIQHCPPHCLP